MPIPKINDNLVERLEANLKIKHNTARSYASNIRGLWRKLNKDKPFGGSLAFVPSRKMIRAVADVTNLSARKNAANAAVAALKVIGGHEKELAEYRQLMMGVFSGLPEGGQKKPPLQGWREGVEESAGSVQEGGQGGISAQPVEAGGAHQVPRLPHTHGPNLPEVDCLGPCPPTRVHRPVTSRPLRTRALPMKSGKKATGL